MHPTASLRSRAATLFTVAAVGLLGLAACGTDEDPQAPTTSTEATESTEPTEPTETTSPSTEPSEEPTETATPAAADALCAAISAEELTSLAGRELTAADASGDETNVSCDVVSEDFSLTVLWQARPAAGSLDEAVEESPYVDLQRSPVTVAGQQGALLSGDSPGQRVAQVVVLVGSQTLDVAVVHGDGVGPEVSPQTMRAVALGVADKAAAALS